VIIDVHGHWGPWFFAMDVGSVRTNLEVMDRYGIDFAIVSASEAVVADPVRGNAALAAVLAHEPRLLGYLVLDPNDPAASERDLDRHLPSGRFVGVKLHTHYSGRPIASAPMQVVLRMAAERGLPVLMHTWGADVLDLADSCVAIDGLRAIAGHMGGPAWELGVEAVRRTDRLYLEPSYSVPERGRLAWVAERVPAERMLFGTDATLIDPAVALGAVSAAQLPAGRHEAMMWRNAAELFALDLAQLQRSRR
jgi:predicted TIM-barrel fold metal-dependent hydrolase